MDAVIHSGQEKLESGPADNNGEEDGIGNGAGVRFQQGDRPYLISGTGYRILLSGYPAR
jgi:hypothetical protein